MAIVAMAFIRKGRLEIRQKQQFRERITRMRDGAVTITVERTHAHRSLQQSRWYWGVILELISEHTGYSPDEVHELLKAKFIPKKLAVCNQNGEITGEFVIGGSTAKLNKVEFGEYCEAIRQWATETLGLVIPDPDTGALWSGARQQTWAS